MMLSRWMAMEGDMKDKIEKLIKRSLIKSKITIEDDIYLKANIRRLVENELAVYERALELASICALNTSCATCQREMECDGGIGYDEFLEEARKEIGDENKQAN